VSEHVNHSNIQLGSRCLDSSVASGAGSPDIAATAAVSAVCEVEVCTLDTSPFGNPDPGPTAVAVLAMADRQ